MIRESLNDNAWAWSQLSLSHKLDREWSRRLRDGDGIGYIDLQIFVRIDRKIFSAISFLVYEAVHNYLSQSIIWFGGCLKTFESSTRTVRNTATISGLSCCLEQSWVDSNCVELVRLPTLSFISFFHFFLSSLLSSLPSSLSIQNTLISLLSIFPLVHS